MSGVVLATGDADAKLDVGDQGAGGRRFGQPGVVAVLVDRGKAVLDPPHQVSCVSNFGDETLPCVGDGADDECPITERGIERVVAARTVDRSKPSWDSPSGGSSSAIFSRKGPSGEPLRPAGSGPVASHRGSRSAGESAPVPGNLPTR